MAVFKNVEMLQQSYLKKVSRQLDFHQELLGLIQQALPSELSKQVTYALPQKHTLILFTAHSNWSSQVRFFQKSLLFQLEQSGYFFTDLQLKIIPPSFNHTPERKINIPKSDTLEFLASQAQHTEDPDIKKALTKLTNTLRRQKSTS